MSVVSLRADIDISYGDMAHAAQEAALVECFTARRPSVGERMAAGKELRAKVPRKSHARHVRDSAATDPVRILEAQNKGRVQALVPLRFGRMLASPFTFLRGAAAVMASDLSATPVSGLKVAACGDMHVNNFGVFASAERNLVFAINDFDEVYPGPWEWDLKRLVASAVVATRFMGGDDHAGAEAVHRAVASYRQSIRRYAHMGNLAVSYSRIGEDAILDAIPSRIRRGAVRALKTARAHGSIRALGKLTERLDGERHIIDHSPMIEHESVVEGGTPIRVAMGQVLRSYLDSLNDDRRRLLSRYRIVDVARKVVGVGSVGTRCWVVLLEGIDETDPLFLQVKQAGPSVLEPYVDVNMRFDHQGRRIVFGQRLTQGSPDIFLGWARGPAGDYYVRQLADMKGSFSEEAEHALEGFPAYCALCGVALALAHAKSGDAAMIAGYCGKSEVLDDALTEYAVAYANQTENDYDSLYAAHRSGHIEARVEAEA